MGWRTGKIGIVAAGKCQEIQTSRRRDESATVSQDNQCGAIGMLAAGCTSSARTSTRALGKPLGANDDIRVAVIGFNQQGKSHIKAYRSISGVRLVAVRCR